MTDDVNKGTHMIYTGSQHDSQSLDSRGSAG
jgi:hypothetical protein